MDFNLYKSDPSTLAPSAVEAAELSGSETMSGKSTPDEEDIR